MDLDKLPFEEDPSYQKIANQMVMISDMLVASMDPNHEEFLMFMGSKEGKPFVNQLLRITHELKLTLSSQSGAMDAYRQAILNLKKSSGSSLVQFFRLFSHLYLDYALDEHIPFLQKVYLSYKCFYIPAFHECINKDKGPVHPYSNDVNSDELPKPVEPESDDNALLCDESFDDIESNLDSPMAVDPSKKSESDSHSLLDAIHAFESHKKSLKRERTSDESEPSISSALLFSSEHHHKRPRINESFSNDSSEEYSPALCIDK